MSPECVGCAEETTIIVSEEGVLFYVGNGRNLLGVSEKDPQACTSIPVALPALLGVRVRSVAVRDGCGHALFVTTQGQIYTSGVGGQDGELGGGKPAAAGKPQPPRLIELPEDKLAICAAVGPRRSAVVCSDGTAWVLGRPVLKKEKKEKRKKKKGEEEKAEVAEVEEDLERGGGKGAKGGHPFGAPVPGRARLLGEPFPRIRDRGMMRGKGGPQGGDPPSVPKKKETEVCKWVAVPPMSAEVVAVSLGDGHVAFVTATGALHTAGESLLGQCGGGQIEKHTELAPVPGLKNVTAVSCGPAHTAVIAEGTLVLFGGLPRGGKEVPAAAGNPEPSPIELPGAGAGGEAVQITCGEGIVAVMTTSGRLFQAVLEEDGCHRVEPIAGQPEVPAPPAPRTPKSLHGEPSPPPPVGLAVAAGRVARLVGSQGAVVPRGSGVGGEGSHCCSMDLDALTVRLEDRFRTFRISDGHCVHEAGEGSMLPEGRAEAVAIHPGANGVWALYPERGCVDLCVEEETGVAGGSGEAPIRKQGPEQSKPTLPPSNGSRIEGYMSIYGNNRAKHGPEQSKPTLAGSRILLDPATALLPSYHGPAPATVEAAEAAVAILAVLEAVSEGGQPCAPPGIYGSGMVLPCAPAPEPDCAKRFSGTCGGWYLGGSPDAIGFEVDDAVSLTGIYMYGDNKSGQFTMKLSLYEGLMSTTCY